MHNHPNKLKIVSFCLWGGNKAYWDGIIKNIRLAEIFYKDWQVCIFIDKYTHLKFKDKTNYYLNELYNSEANVFVLDQQPGNMGMFWRMLPILWSQVDRVIIRDCDSLISERESLAVFDWEKSDRVLHIMRDHPGHTEFIMGGMFGVKVIQKVKEAFSPIVELLKFYRDKQGGTWQVDQVFLKRFIYPIFVNDCCIHDEFFEGYKFPSKRKDSEYIGAPVLRDTGDSYNELISIENYLNTKNLNSQAIEIDQSLSIKKYLANYQIFQSGKSMIDKRYIEKYRSEGFLDLMDHGFAIHNDFI